MSEQVLVVSKEELFKVLDGNYFIKDNLDQIYSTINTNYVFMDRTIAENNYHYKQIIPYIIIKCRERFLVMTRTKKQDEKRLHNMKSLGIGGHINPCDLDSNDIIQAGLQRELSEEIRLEGSYGDIKLVGVIDDESNEVGEVHLGLVYLLEVESEDFEILEKDKMIAEWISILELLGNHADLESWSQIVLKNYILQ
jgi:predicted NUDIX family phosphoesterase